MIQVDLIQTARAASETTLSTWMPLLVAVLTSALTLAAIIVTARTAKRTILMNAEMAVRQKLMEIVREDLAELLAVGECHLAPDERKPYSPEKGQGDLKRLCHTSKRLRVSLGRKYKERIELGRLVGEFAATPTAALEERIEEAAQRVFETWMKRFREERRPWWRRTLAKLLEGRSGTIMGSDMGTRSPS